ncbi:MAG: chromate efflux transporter [Verrucomicrobiia bacterium]
MKQASEILWQFFLLGFASFGGPAAHLGYFRRVFVEQLEWLDEKAYARLIALGQFLPGPGSSQVGFALGCQRAGLAGGLAAFIGFTTPSFLLMYALSAASAGVLESGWFTGLVHGLKLLAVVVVTDATLNMFKSFCRTILTRILCALTTLTLLLQSGVITQLGSLMIAAIIGSMAIRSEDGNAPKTAGASDSESLRIAPLALFGFLFLALPFVAPEWSAAKLFAEFYHTGSLVFGGGHVVLPLLQSQLGDTVSPDRFLTGYAAAQGVPGPMFSLAAFLGAEMTPHDRFIGALVATLGIFLPGFLLVLGLQGAWERLAAKPRLAGAVTAINASVVGLLAAAWYKPVFIGAFTQNLDLLWMGMGFAALRFLKVPIVVMVIGFAVLGVLTSR